MLKNIQSYRYQKEIDLLQQLSTNSVNSIDWSALIKELRCSQETKGLTETWYLVMKNNNDAFVNSSNDGLEVIEDENDGMDISWLFIKMFDISVSKEEQKLFHPSIIQHTEKLTDIIKSIEGVIHVGFHFILPNSRIPPHTDYEESKWYHILITPDISIEGVTMTLSDTTFDLNRNQVVVFDAAKPHSIENKSDNSFVCLVLMVESEYFDV